MQACESATRNVQLELFQKLRMILINDENRDEFKALNGYNQLIEIIIDAKPGEESFAISAIHTMKDIALGGSNGNYVENIHAFSALFRIAAISTELYMIAEAFTSIKAILTLSWENVLPIIFEET